MNNFILTEEQEKLLKIKDERVDFYFKIENSVVDDPKLFTNIYESHLYMVIARFCNNNQVAFPSYAKLSELCYCSRSTIIRSIAYLEKKGYINKVTRKREDNSQINNTNLYTLNNLKEYTMKDRESSSSSEGGGVPETLGVVRVRHQGGVRVTPYKEQTINNKIKKNNTTTTTTKDIDNQIKLDEKTSMTIESSSSTIFEFLDLEEFKKINHITKKNIRKNIKNLNIETLREVYKKAELEVSIGTGKIFDAILYNGLKNDWNFSCSDNKNKTTHIGVTPVMDEAKSDWLRYFSGVKSDPAVYKYVKEKILTISIELLRENKNKMKMMDAFEFKNHICYLSKQNSF